MTEKRKLRALLAKVAKEDGAFNYKAMEEAIVEAGYRLPLGKAPLLTDAQRMRVVIPCVDKCGSLFLASSFKCLDCVAIQHEKAQNDADNKHFGVSETKSAIPDGWDKNVYNEG